MKMVHAKFIHMKNLWSCVVSHFPLCYIRNMGGCDRLQVGIVSRKCPEQVYGFAVMKNGELSSGRVRLSFSIDFDNYASKSAFGNRLEYIHSLLTPTGHRNLDNHGLMNALFDLVEQAIPGSFRVVCWPVGPSVICQLVQCYLSIGPVLSVSWSSVICQLVRCYLSVGQVLSVSWSSVICQLVQCYLTVVPVLSVSWSGVICQLVQCYLSVGPVLSVSWSVVICQCVRVICQLVQCYLSVGPVLSNNWSSVICQ